MAVQSAELTLEVPAEFYTQAGKAGLSLGILGALVEQLLVSDAATSSKAIRLALTGSPDVTARACKAIQALLDTQSGELPSHISVEQEQEPGAAQSNGIGAHASGSSQRAVLHSLEDLPALLSENSSAAAAPSAEFAAAPVAIVTAAAAEARAMATRARAASRALQLLPSAQRVAMLERLAALLQAHTPEILEANALDVAQSQGKVSDSLLQRLVLKPAKIQSLVAGLTTLAQQEEPLGRCTRRMELAEGLVLDRISVPIGVLLIIFEARPEALIQIAALAIRSGNGLLLKGGKEATHSNAILHKLVAQAVGPELGADLVGLVTSREQINDLLALDDVIDLVIPRGGNALVSFVQRSTRIPVLGHADGICHAYVDVAADLGMAAKVLVDAKVDYPAACNAIEKVLVHAHWLAQPGTGAACGVASLCGALQAAGVTVHSDCPRVLEVVGSLPPPPSARHEYSSLDVTLQVVDSMAEAIQHIHGHGSSHTEIILTEDVETAEAFLSSVDAACVFHNASSRFGDGFRFGLGAEVGISTSRIHARGPVGVEGLLTSKWMLRGAGHVVAKDQGVVYTHRALPVA